MQLSSEGAAYSSDRVRRSSDSSVGCSLAQWKDIRSWRPEFGPEGKHFVYGNSFNFYFLGSSEAAMGGAQRPFGVFMSPERRVRASEAKNPLVVNTVLPMRTEE